MQLVEVSRNRTVKTHVWTPSFRHVWNRNSTSILELLFQSFYFFLKITFFTQSNLSPCSWKYCEPSILCFMYAKSRLFKQNHVQNHFLGSGVTMKNFQNQSWRHVFIIVQSICKKVIYSGRLIRFLFFPLKFGFTLWWVLFSLNNHVPWNSCPVREMLT